MSCTALSRCLCAPIAQECTCRTHQHTHTHLVVCVWVFASSRTRCQKAVNASCLPLASCGHRTANWLWKFNCCHSGASIMCGAHNNLQRQLSAWRIGQSAVCLCLLLLLPLPPPSFVSISGSDHPEWLVNLTSDDCDWGWHANGPCHGTRRDKTQRDEAPARTAHPETLAMYSNCVFFYVAISTNPPPYSRPQSRFDMTKTPTPFNNLT